MQVIINIVLATVAVYGAVLSTINLLQRRRETQQRLSVNMKQTVMELPRIPDGSGHRSAAPVHVFIIQAVNSGLLPVTLKDAGIQFSGGVFLAKAFSPRYDKQFPLELAPGDDLEVHVDAYGVLKDMKGNGISGDVVVRGCFTTPLKQHKSKKVRLNVELLANNVELTEGSWRK